MRIPSLRQAARQAGHALGRFPLALLSAAGAAALGVILLGDGWHSELVVRAFLACLLGIPLTVALAIATEPRGSEFKPMLPVWRWSIRLAGAASLVAFGVAAGGWSDEVMARRFFQFAVAAHLAVAFLPFARTSGTRGFWQFNRTLFLRFLLTAIYSATLYAGLSLALAALDRLLGVHVPAVTYPRLGCVIAFVFNTWVFLAGVPGDRVALDWRTDYPTALKVFSQFILIPLVAIYVVILTIYLGRVLVSGQWPSGWIGWLVTGVSATGILSLLLIHPIREREENRWVRIYAQGFWIALIPSIGMLLASIYKRIEQYGVTENRYFMAVLALWLAGIALASMARGRTHVRAIPASLCVVALLTAWGPWGAYTVSRESQLARLERLLARYGLPAAATRPAAGGVPVADRREMSAALVYLFETHGRDAVPARLAGPITSVPPDSFRTFGHPRALALERARDAMAHLGLEYVAPGRPGLDPDRIRFLAQRPPEPVSIAGFDYELAVDRPPPIAFQIEDTSYRLELDRPARALRLSRDGVPLVAMPLEQAIAQARAGFGGGGPAPPLRLEGEGSGIRARLDLTSLYGYARRDSLRVDGLGGTLWIGFVR